MKVTRRGFLGGSVLASGAAWLPTGGTMSGWAPEPTVHAHTGTIGVFVAKTAPVSQLSMYQGRERFRQNLRRELENLERNIMREYDRSIPPNLRD